MPESTAADHIESARLLAHAGNYVGANAHAAIAAAILLHTDALQWKLLDAWRESAARHRESGNLEYSLAMSDCEEDLREVLRHNRKPNGIA